MMDEKELKQVLLKRFDDEVDKAKMQRHTGNQDVWPLIHAAQEKVYDELKKHPEWCEDKKLIMAVVGRGMYNALDLIGPSLREDINFMREVFVSFPAAAPRHFTYLFDNRDFMMSVVKKDGSVVQHFPIPNKYVDYKICDAVRSYAEGQVSDLQHYISHQNLLNDFFYQAMLSMVERKLMQSFAEICGRQEIGMDDELPEEIQKAMDEKLAKTAQIIIEERKSQIKKAVTKIENLPV